MDVKEEPKLGTETENLCEKKIPVFTVLKNNSILKNIFLLDAIPPSISESDSTEEKVIVIGRHPDCCITLDHPSISRFHLRLHSKPSSLQLSLVDLLSVHGTWVSGKKIEPGVQVELKEGDTVRLGGSSRLYMLHWVPISRAYDLGDSFVPPMDVLMPMKEREVASQDHDCCSSVETNQFQSLCCSSEGLYSLISENNMRMSPSVQPLSEPVDTSCYKEEEEHRQIEISVLSPGKLLERSVVAETEVQQSNKANEGPKALSEVLTRIANADKDLSKAEHEWNDISSLSAGKLLMESVVAEIENQQFEKANENPQVLSRVLAGIENSDSPNIDHNKNPPREENEISSFSSGPLMKESDVTEIETQQSDKEYNNPQALCRVLTGIANANSPDIDHDKNLSREEHEENGTFGFLSRLFLKECVEIEYQQPDKENENIQVSARILTGITNVDSPIVNHNENLSREEHEEYEISGSSSGQILKESAAEIEDQLCDKENENRQALVRVLTCIANANSPSPTDHNVNLLDFFNSSLYDEDEEILCASEMDHEQHMPTSGCHTPCSYAISESKDQLFRDEQNHDLEYFSSTGAHARQSLKNTPGKLDQEVSWSEDFKHSLSDEDGCIVVGERSEAVDIHSSSAGKNEQKEITGISCRAPKIDSMKLSLHSQNIPTVICVEQLDENNRDEDCCLSLETNLFQSLCCSLECLDSLISRSNMRMSPSALPLPLPVDASCYNKEEEHGQNEVYLLPPGQHLKELVVVEIEIQQSDNANEDPQALSKVLPGIENAYSDSTDNTKNLSREEHEGNDISSFSSGPLLKESVVAEIDQQSEKQNENPQALSRVLTGIAIPDSPSIDHNKNPPKEENEISGFSSGPLMKELDTETEYRQSDKENKNPQALSGVLTCIANPDSLRIDHNKNHPDNEISGVSSGPLLKESDIAEIETQQSDEENQKPQALSTVLTGLANANSPRQDHNKNLSREEHEENETGFSSRLLLKDSIELVYQQSKEENENRQDGMKFLTGIANANSPIVDHNENLSREEHEEYEISGFSYGQILKESAAEIEDQLSDTENENPQALVRGLTCIANANSPSPTDDNVSLLDFFNCLLSDEDVEILCASEVDHEQHMPTSGCYTPCSNAILECKDELLRDEQNDDLKYFSSKGVQARRSLKNTSGKSDQEVNWSEDLKYSSSGEDGCIVVGERSEAADDLSFLEGNNEQEYAEEIFITEKENCTPNTLQRRSNKKTNKVEERKNSEHLSLSPSKNSANGNIVQHEELLVCSDKENHTPKDLQERKLVRPASKNHARLNEEIAAKNRVSRVPFQSLLSVSSSKNYPNSDSTIRSSNFVRNAQRIEKNADAGDNKRWIMIADTNCLLNNASRKALQLLQGLKGTRLIIPRMVIRELDYMKRRGYLFTRTTDVSLALEWIENCMIKTNWWIQIQSSVEEGRHLATTPPITPRSSSKKENWALSFTSASFSAYANFLEIVSPTAGDHVLECALHLRKMMYNQKIVILSDDVSMKIKAMAEGMICEAAEEFRESLVNPFSDRFLWAKNSPRGLTWSCTDDIFLREKYYRGRFKKVSKSGESSKGLKLILLHNSHFGQLIPHSCE